MCSSKYTDTHTLRRLLTAAMDRSGAKGKMDFPTYGSSPRKNSGLIIILAVLLAVIFLVIGIFRLISSPDPADSKKSGASTQEADVPAVTQHPGDNTTASSREDTHPSKVAHAVPEGRETLPPSATETEAHPSQPTPPASSDPHEDLIADFEELSVPPLPYSIYYGAFETTEEARTTVRELESHGIPAYISPVTIQGSMARSMYAVSKDGTWYRVLVGHFASKEEARKTLGRLLEATPDAVPEIMRYDYALECGRFVDAAEAAARMTSLQQHGFLPYMQTCPAVGDKTLKRILLGCFFSSRGAQISKERAMQQGFDCTVVER